MKTFQSISLAHLFVQRHWKALIMLLTLTALAWYVAGNTGLFKTNIIFVEQGDFGTVEIDFLTIETDEGTPEAQSFTIDGVAPTIAGYENNVVLRAHGPQPAHIAQVMPTVNFIYNSGDSQQLLSVVAVNETGAYVDYGSFPDGNVNGKIVITDPLTQSTLARYAVQVFPAAGALSEGTLSEGAATTVTGGDVVVSVTGTTPTTEPTVTTTVPDTQVETTTAATTTTTEQSVVDTPTSAAGGDQVEVDIASIPDILPVTDFCGDGIVQFPNSQGIFEGCEPPNTPTCDATCQPIPSTFCGDGIIQAPEECELPNRPGCDANCKIIEMPIAPAATQCPGDCPPFVIRSIASKLVENTAAIASIKTLLDAGTIGPDVKIRRHIIAVTPAVDVDDITGDVVLAWERVSKISQLSADGINPDTYKDKDWAWYRLYLDTRSSGSFGVVYNATDIFTEYFFGVLDADFDLINSVADNVYYNVQAIQHLHSGNVLQFVASVIESISQFRASQ